MHASKNAHKQNLAVRASQFNDWLVLVKKDAALLYLEPASNTHAFSSELGIANFSSLQGLDCFVAALPGEKAAAGQKKPGGRLCLKEEL